MSVVLIRATSFKSKQVRVEPVSDFPLNTEQIADRLSKAIQFETISYQEPAKLEKKEFIGLQNYIEKTFPKVHTTLSKKVIGDYSLLYTWEGNAIDLKPILLMGHLDVVPVKSETVDDWTHPPFSGSIADGYIWGRGAMDVKVSVLSILEAVEILLEQGFQTHRTIYLAFGHDEEVGGSNGAREIATLLQSREVKLEYVLDEGGMITEGIIPGIYDPIALVGIAEKGYVSIELSVEAKGGHSSMPPKQTALGILSTAITKLEKNQFPAKLTGPARRLLEYIGPEQDFPNKVFSANLWLFSSLVKRQLGSSPATNALIRTTTAPTMFEGSDKENILPSEASAVVNFRILPGQSINDVIDHVRNTIDDPRINLRLLNLQIEPSIASDVESPIFNLIQTTIHEIFPDVLVTPWLVVGATDSRYYAELTNNIYRFIPIRIGPEDASRFHGLNERISISDYENCVRFFTQLIRNSNM
ncbi:M20 family peptidase [Desulfobacterota bacterium AH_259_B03_O07]|nr:M20 family peptidase [Desulfobacterota bacterium AH_259_B03_O07]